MAQRADWEHGRGSMRRWLVLAFAVVAVAGAGAVAQRGTTPDRSSPLRVEEATAPDAGADRLPAVAGRVADLAPGALLPGRWRPVQSGPLTGRSRASMTWTGQEAVIWGGLGAQPHDDGATYDPVADAWSVLPKSLLSPRFGHAAVWTGSEVVIAGGASRPRPGADPVVDLADAAAFNPRTQQWRSLPPLPFATGAGHLFAAAGRIFAVAAAVGTTSVAALEAGGREWIVLPVTRPGGVLGDTAGAVEAGVAHNELVVWNRRGRGSGVAIDIADPSRWRPLERAPQPLTDVGACCVLVASQAGGAVDVIAYDRARDIWRPVGEGTGAELAVSPDLVFLVRLEGSSGALDLRTGTPVRLPPAPVTARVGAAVAWAGDRLLVWGGGETATGDSAADGAAFVMPP